MSFHKKNLKKKVISEENNLDKKKPSHLHKSRYSDIVSTQCLDKSHYLKVGLEDCHEVRLLLSANQSE